MSNYGTSLILGIFWRLLPQILRLWSIGRLLHQQRQVEISVAAHAHTSARNGSNWLIADGIATTIATTQQLKAVASVPCFGGVFDPFQHHMH